MHIVRQQDGLLVVSSREVAVAFEKEHKNVLQSIETVGCPPDFRFRATELGLHHRSRHTATGCMKRGIKEKFLPRGARSVMTFKEIRQADYPAALSYITHWDFSSMAK